MVPSSVVNQFRRVRADERGAVSVMMGFLLIPLVGFLAMGFEVSNWYLITRGMQLRRRSQSRGGTVWLREWSQ
jgi:Flp pilus assembly protein TadG